MSHWAVIVLIVIGAIWGIGVFLGYITGITKGFDSQQEIQSIDPSEVRNKQKEIVEEAEEKRRQLMESYQQRIRDQQRQF